MLNPNVISCPDKLLTTIYRQLAHHKFKLCTVAMLYVPLKTVMLFGQCLKKDLILLQIPSTTQHPKTVQDSQVLCYIPCLSKSNRPYSFILLSFLTGVKSAHSTPAHSIFSSLHHIETVPALFCNRNSIRANTSRNFVKFLSM